RRRSAAMPSAVNRLCDATSAVFEITTEARPSAPLTRQRRRRYAFSGSPPTAAAGVRLFTASPALRGKVSEGNGTLAPAARGSGGGRRGRAPHRGTGARGGGGGGAAQRTGGPGPQPGAGRAGGGSRPRRARPRAPGSTVVFRRRSPPRVGVSRAPAPAGSGRT